MAKKQESKWNIDDLTDAEIDAAIRYLEPDRRSATEQKQNDDTAFGICFCLVILLLVCIGFVWLYR